MDEVIRFVIPGCPVGKGRPRFVRATGRTYTPEKTVSYENYVKLVFKDAYPHFRPYEKNVPLEVCIDAGFTPPNSVSQKRRKAMLDGDVMPTKVPDADNVGKAILDALHGMCYLNDSSVVRLCITKRYTSTPRTVVSIREVEGANSPK